MSLDSLMQLIMMGSSILLTILVVALVIMIVSYVWSGIVYGKILRVMGYNKPWLIWVPIARGWALWWLATDDNGTPFTKVYGKLPVPDVVLKLMWLIVPLLFRIPLVGALIGFIVYIIFANWLYDVIAAKCLGTSVGSQWVLGIVGAWFPFIYLIIATTWLSSLVVEEKDYDL